MRSSWEERRGASTGMMLSTKTDSTQAFIQFQNRFRGLISQFRSRRFVENQRVLPHRVFRSSFQDLLLDARAAISPSEYRPYLEWLAEQTQAQLGDLTSIPTGYDDLTGIYSKAPAISLEYELLWLTERFRTEAQKLNLFNKAVALVQQAAFAGEYESAIAGIDAIQEALGVSLWSVQLRLALEHLAGGLERQKRYSAQLRNIHRAGLLNFTVYHTSVRNEDRTTLSKFLDDIDQRITGLTQHSEPTKTYDRYRLKNEFPNTDEGLAEILRVEQSHGITDIYETFVAVLQELVRRQPDPERATLIVDCIASIDVDDFRLWKITEILDSTRQFALPVRITEISDALFEGRLYRAMRLACRITSDDPWEYIYAGLALASASRERNPVSARPTEVAELIARVQRRSNGSEDAWAQLTKLALNLRGLPLAAGLFECLMQLRRIRPDQPWQPWLVGLNSPYRGIEDRLWGYGCSRDGSACSPTDKAWYEASCPGADPAKSCRLIRAIGHIDRGEYGLAGDALADLSDTWPQSLRNLGALVQLHVFWAQGMRQEVISLIANEGTRSPTHARFLPVVSALKNYLWKDFKAVDRSLAAPNALHLLWSEQEVSETASMMRFATGHALRRLAVARPSDLQFGLLNIDRHELIYFFRKVCVPGILDLSRLFSGTRAILEERQAICGLLSRFDSKNLEIYQSEIILIANDLEMDDGRWIVDSTRIHVDSDGLMRWALRELAEDYGRYRDLVDIDVLGPQSFDDVLQEIERNSANKAAFVPDNEADAVLVSILRRLGEEFLTNAAFGLDFYLSKRVRHQSFIGLIRGPLEFADLITTRESEAGEYHRNNVWLNRFDHADETAQREIDNALRNFAIKFDEILMQAKDAYFHLRSIEKPQGMILLTLNRNMISLARALIRLDLNFSEFIRVVLPILWTGIESSLSQIRTFITDDMKSRIINEFDIVRARIRELAEQDGAWLEFDATMGGASSEVQIKLDEVAQWFVHADTLRQHRLFSLEQILKIGVDTALKSQRGFSPQISQNAQGDLELPASNLVFVHDVVFVGLGNARKHSGMKSPKVDVTAQWNEADSTLSLVVVSDCRPSFRADKERQANVIRKMIEEGSHDRRTRTEGGSGFAKLAAVVTQSDRGSIKFAFTAEGRFRLDVTYEVRLSTGGASDDN